MTIKTSEMLDALRESYAIRRKVINLLSAEFPHEILDRFEVTTHTHIDRPKKPNFLSKLFGGKE